MINNLLLVRVDDRLIHGQVMTAWMKVHPAEVIYVVDNNVCKDDFMQFVLQNAAPKGVKVKVTTEEGIVDILNAGLSKPSYILCKTPLSLKKIVESQIDISQIIIGGMGMNEKRTTLYRNIAATKEERECINDFIDYGIEVNIQIIPSDKKYTLSKVEY